MTVKETEAKQRRMNKSKVVAVIAQVQANVSREDANALQMESCVKAVTKIARTWKIAS